MNARVRVSIDDAHGTWCQEARGIRRTPTGAARRRLAVDAAGVGFWGWFVGSQVKNDELITGKG